MIGARGATFSLVLVGLLAVGFPVATAAYSSLAPATSPQTTQISIVFGAGTVQGTLGFSPDTVKVVIGVNNTVTWTDNDNSMDANGYTPDHVLAANDGSFTSQPLNPGDTFTYTFTTPGTYPYHCNVHSWMSGTVVVLGSGGSTTSSTSSTSSSTGAASTTSQSSTTTPAPEFPLPIVALLAAVAACAAVFRLATKWSTRTPAARAPKEQRSAPSR